MPAKTYRPSFDQRTFDKADGLYNKARDHSERDLIPRIQQRNHQALNVVPDLFHFYRRSNTGRRCSCWQGIETSPNSQCLVCYGSGNTAGYQLHGHIDEPLDVTMRWDSVNVVVDYDNVTRPLHFRLAHGAKTGYVDFLMEVRPNVGVISHASIHASFKRSTFVTAGVKLLDEEDFVLFSTENLQSRLADAVLKGGILVRVVLNRSSVSAPSPRFSHARIRYQFLQDDKIRADVPRAPEANRSSEFGWFDEAATRNMFLDNTLTSITTEDFFKDLRSNRRWKVVMVNDNAPAGRLTSWDCETQIIQPTSRFSFIP